MRPTGSTCRQGLHQHPHMIPEQLLFLFAVMGGTSGLFIVVATRFFLASIAAPKIVSLIRPSNWSHSRCAWSALIRVRARQSIAEPKPPCLLEASRTARMPCTGV